MSDPEANPPGQDQLLQEAAAWFARMRGPEAEASRGEFEAWLRRGALHRQAYNRAAEIFAMGKILAEDRNPGGSEPVRESGESGRRRFIRVPLGALFAMIAAGLLAVQFLPSGEPARDRIVADPGDRPAQPQIVSTTPGQVRTLRLADGSLVRLEGGSLIEVRLGASERSLRLRRGRARFEVAHELRPFVVDAGGGRVTARGTLFEVELTADRRVTVRLIAGAVDVTLPRGSAPDRERPATRRLRPGQAVSYAVPGGQSRVPPPSAEGSMAGASGAAPQSARDYENIALADLIAAANGGSDRPIRLADPALGERRVSGRFRVDDTLLLAERLALLFDLAIDHRLPGEIVLRGR